MSNQFAKYDRGNGRWAGAWLRLPSSVLSCLLCGLWTTASLAQGMPGDYYAGPASTITPAIAPAESVYQSLDELTRKLKETEARLQRLEGKAASDDPDYGDNFASYSANSELLAPAAAAAKPKTKKWYEKYTISGYAQFRISETVHEAPGSAEPQLVGDGSVGPNKNFFIRRARLIIAGDVTDHVSIYLQPDFASNVPGSPDANQFAQIRDWYADLYLDDYKEYRVRVGQSKVPYGWENLQSSRNRIPLDRNDGLNSAVRNERDLGAFFYWTPTYAQDFFKAVLDEGLKGSGNYGVFGLGVYNGQGGSFVEQNDNLHMVSRVTLPIELESGQLMELGIQGYFGKYTVLSSTISPLGVGAAVRPTGTLETDGLEGIMDRRIAGSFIYYPQPWGFQAEWNVGRGPGLNPAQTAVVDRALYGGYAMAMYRWETDCHGELWPFIRWNYYKGGYKTERNAPYVDIDEWEAGLEWQISKNVELVTMYTITDRTNTRALSTANTRSYEQFEGQLLRFQLQVNY